MWRAAALLGSLGIVGAARDALKPVVKHVDLASVYGPVATIQREEFDDIEQIFAYAQLEVLKASRENATLRAALERQARAGAPAGAPAEAPAASPGSAPASVVRSRGPEGAKGRIPATGPAWVAPPHLKGLTEENGYWMKWFARPKFVPLCAQKIEDLATKNGRYLAENGASNDTIGLSLATHFQVICEGAFPLEEEDCDKTSVQLAKLVETGGAAALNPPPGAPGGAPAAALANLRAAVARAPAPAASPGAAPGPAEAPPAGPSESGPGWCWAFFNLYFDAVIKANR